MKRYLRMIASALFMMLLIDQWLVWGGLGRAPQIGATVRAAAARETSIAATHVRVGGWIAQNLIREQTAIDLARWRFSAAIPAIRANPAAPLDTARGHMPIGVRISYYGWPPMLLVTLWATWRRARELHRLQQRQ